MPESNICIQIGEQIWILKIALSQDEDGWFIVTVPALPGCVSQGKTEEEAKKNIAEAIELHLSALARHGIPFYHRPGTKESFVAVDILRTNFMDRKTILEIFFTVSHPAPIL